MKKRRFEEDDNQRALFHWAMLAAKRIPQLELLFAVPNGGKRNAREAARLKGMGVRPGVPDLLLPCPALIWHGLAIEMKSQKGRLRPSQEYWHMKLREVGWQVNVCRSWMEAREIICAYLGVKP